MDEERIKRHIKAAQKKIAAQAKAIEQAEELKRQEELNSRVKEREAAEKSRPIKSVDDIIANGTIEEKSFAIINDYDFKKVTGKRTLTPQQKKAIENSISSDFDRMIYKEYAKLYSDLGQYAEKLSYVFKAYQIEISLLANLLTKWDMYEEEAKMMTTLMRTENKSYIKLAEALSKVIPSLRSEKVRFHFDTENEIVKADIFFEGGLYKDIKEQAKEATDQLTIVKAYIEAIEDYVYSNEYLAFMPSTMDMTITNVKEEIFSRSFIKKKYHRSELNYKKIDRKEPVTEEEELLGIVPDYIEIKRDESAFEYCKLGIKIIRDGKK